ncbi:MAG: aminotransferase class I/II-fold pyridoxal phosphate-dependent enzyme [Paludibacteraceae bacterium]|nr:aminotransferase class I/II-fold pyridoxal phosphate-dependent enzyme [Paludibacteraceae bacterium]
MINGHGDDIYDYAEIKANFSSNVYGRFPHNGLYDHLTQKLPTIENYPEPTPKRLECVVAKHSNISSNEVLVTNGATQAIYQIAQAFRGSHSSVLVPTFSEYADACRMHGHSVSFFQSLKEIPPKTQLVWLCNPNNPTGQLIDKDFLLGTIQSLPDTVFIVDASYAAFVSSPVISPQEAVSLQNVVLLHSMTKDFSIPGLRLGYMTAHATLIDKIALCSVPWTVNQLAIEAGLYIFSHLQDYSIDLIEMLEEACRVSASLQQIGIEVLPSDMHILLCRLPKGRASDLKNFLVGSYGVLIRDASNFEGLDSSYFRIAIQTPKENELLIKGISEWMA